MDNQFISGQDLDIFLDFIDGDEFEIPDDIEKSFEDAVIEVGWPFIIEIFLYGIPNKLCVGGP